MSKRPRVEAAYLSKTLAYAGSNLRFEASGPANSSTKMAYRKLRFQPAAFLRSVFWATKFHTIDTEMKATRDDIISELITLRITKAKAKENSGRGGGRSMKFT